MGIFKERRTSLPAMSIKVQEVETRPAEASELDTEFVHKMSTPAGVDIVTQVELQPRSGLGPGGHLAQGPGRVDLPRSVPGPGGQGDLCLVRLEPCTSDQSLYCVRLATNIPTFQLKTSCTFRSFSDWYYLQRVLRSSFPHLKIRDLPPRHELWVTDTGTRVQEIAAFLQRVLAIRQLLLCNIVHLFLQSHLSVEFIQENVDGKRQDDVSLIPRIPRIEFNLDNDHSVFENILKLKLDEQKTVESSQKTYHGPTTQPDSHKSVQNLFKKRKSSGQTNNMMAHLQALAEDSNFETNSRNKQRGSIVY